MTLREAREETDKLIDTGEADSCTERQAQLFAWLAAVRWVAAEVGLHASCDGTGRLGPQQRTRCVCLARYPEDVQQAVLELLNLQSTIDHRQ